MILTELLDYLKERRRASLIEIAHRFDTEPDAIRGMLQKWVVKGRLEKSLQTTDCGTGCCKCDPASTEIYAWKD